ncbi:Octicosapeptide/Phox/Bem1p family protein [Perilla frutescens var. hirtella]|uniref:Octicosapeptide/Phox/Bem1p family protein n=1 Tax=Perilla frutescens var. hirtella TaxID=608512 RepID=A0AAD4J159_PERFH|nr:Octicosapeptide/Phox/Bem1p family protein [Perilla frutescens var. hirtella]
MVGAPVNSHKLTLKFLCSYGGRILPRYPDGKLRYHGGETQLLVKLAEMFGNSVTLRCQLPTEDLDALVSITSNEDLANLVEEYDRAAAASPSSSLKIRAFLSAPKTTKKSSSSPSSSPSSSSNGSTSPKSPFYSSLPPRCPNSGGGRCIRHASRPPVYPIIGEKAAGKLPHNYVYKYHSHSQGNGGHVFVVQNGNHWQ